MVADEATDPASLHGRLATARSEPTGQETFARFTWQAKQAVRLWLTCVSERPGPSFLACEHVEDITIVYDDGIRFLQLKTRDGGSWSIAKMQKGLNSLVRAYVAAAEVGLAGFSTFELWLEGPISDKAETVKFVADPSTVAVAHRKKLIEYRAELDPPPGNSDWLDDFLSRLIICPDQPPRNTIDAKCLQEIGAIWTSRTASESLVIYERLLTEAESAQEAQLSPRELRRQLAARMHQHELDFDERPWHRTPELASLRPQLLDRQALKECTPPLPGEPPEKLLARIAGGSSMSALELKLRAAGASDKTVTLTQKLRAEMEIRRQVLLAGRTNAEYELDRLADRVLMVAEATATSVDLSAAANPAAAARPAEFVAVTLTGEPQRLAAVDSQRLFDGDGLAVYGYLAHLSDQCRFPWRNP